MSLKQYLQARAIHTGAEWRLKFSISSSAPISFPDTAKFKCQIRAKPDEKVLAEMTTDNGGIIRVNDNSLELYMKGDKSKNWKVPHVLLDIIRTDLMEPVHLGFTLKVPVNRSITQV